MLAITELQAIPARMRTHYRRRDEVTITDDAEYAQRNAANIEWMRQAFDYAKKNNSMAAMILTQANPKFEDTPPERRKKVDRCGAAVEKAQRLRRFSRGASAIIDSSDPNVFSFRPRMVKENFRGHQTK
jgi:hypothetical protein